MRLHQPQSQNRTHPKNEKMESVIRQLTETEIRVEPRILARPYNYKGGAFFMEKYS